jgi:hypothetical protein
MFQFFIAYFFHSQIWLIQLMDGCHLSYITKLKENRWHLIGEKLTLIFFIYQNINLKYFSLNLLIN